ncbi:hypothetical protein PV733_31595 [Streptomyces europaeiscabiei]|uniref:hypothetical protein n=1 Tax=Streptomyces europaeiscabiei TaxID=146819 RepID=UPI0029BD1885|nr:hypothetical protein [Streptomyces europaeiscabiei]MDX3713408.1 hypothetical protein [Streptomyces europaeiscabiei]
MTEALTAAIEAAAEELADISDPVERYQAARELRAELDRGDRVFKDAQQGAVNELKSGRPWREVGGLIGVSGSRAEQISRGQ